jgi:hypothetical protein
MSIDDVCVWLVCVCGREVGRSRVASRRVAALLPCLDMVVMSPFLWLGLAVMVSGTSAEPVSTGARVVVYGSTPGGISAAVAAARNNVSVTLLSESVHIGGMMSGGLSCVDSVKNTTVGGIAREYIEAVAKQYYYPNIGHANCFATAEPHVLQHVFVTLMASAGVDVVINAPLERVEMHGTVINTVVAAGTHHHASVFIDASYEGDLLAASGVSYTIGREANSTHGEPHAGRRPLSQSCYPFPAPVDPRYGNGSLLPLVATNASTLPPEGAADKKLVAYNFRLCLTNASVNRVEIAQPADYDPTQFELVRRFMHASPPQSIHQLIKLYAIANVSHGFKVDVNNVGPLSTDLIGASWGYPEASAAERRRIKDAHEQYTRGLLWFFRTDPSVPRAVRQQMAAFGWCADEFSDTNFFPPQLYVREARRMLGEAIFTENNATASTDYGEGSIGMGSYSFDSHPIEIVAVDGNSANSPTAASSQATIEGCVGAGPRHPYQIPLGAILPQRTQCTNLIVPVALSATHVAFSSIRMELTWMVLGHSAGTLAAMATAPPSAVQEVGIHRLYHRLRAERQILRAEDR